MNDPYDPVPADAYPDRQWDAEGKGQLGELMTLWLNVGAEEFWAEISGLLTMYNMSVSEMVDAMAEAAREYFSEGLAADYEQSGGPQGALDTFGRP